MTEAPRLTTIEDTKEQTEKTPFEERVMADFYNSFKFSQQEPYLQKWLMVYTAREYSAIDKKCIINQSPRFQKHVDTLTLPIPHGKVYVKASQIIDETPKQVIKREFHNQWSIQMKFFYYTLYPNPTLHSANIIEHMQASDEMMLQTILSGITFSETALVTRGRPNRPPETKYESYFRTYGILHTPTSHPASALYDGLFTQLGALAEAKKDTPTHPLTGLVYAWEEKHPGETFFPVSA